MRPLAPSSFCGGTSDNALSLANKPSHLKPLWLSLSRERERVRKSVIQSSPSLLPLSHKWERELIRFPTTSQHSTRPDPPYSYSVILRDHTPAPLPVNQRFRRFFGHCDAAPESRILPSQEASPLQTRHPWRCPHPAGRERGPGISPQFPADAEREGA